MNALSWMIYLADVVGDINFMTGLIFFIGAVAAVAGGFITMFALAEDDLPEWAWGAWGKFIASMVAVAFIGIITPGEKTIYAIAASEMGEKALNTETGGKAVKALNAWLDKQIAGEKSE